MFRSMLILVALTGGTSTVVAQEPKTVGPCEDRGTNGMVSALLCPAGLELEVLADAGRVICDGRTDCGAWIWTDVENVPIELPNSHDSLSPEAVRSALGIWVEGQQNLILMEKVAK